MPSVSFIDNFVFAANNVTFALNGSIWSVYPETLERAFSLSPLCESMFSGQICLSQDCPQSIKWIRRPSNQTNKWLCFRLVGDEKLRPRRFNSWPSCLLVEGQDLPMISVHVNSPSHKGHNRRITWKSNPFIYPDTQFIVYSPTFR